jgi:opacity protein-like surface antigen
MKLRLIAAGLIASVLLPSAASAQSWYAGGSIGAVFQSDSDNSGVTGAFNTGNGSPAVPNGTAVAAGTPYGWTTEFDNGLALSGEVGLRYDSGWRSGVEIVYTQADIDTHSGVTLGGTNIDGVDAAVIAGSPTLLGVTVGQVVDDGQGEIKNLGAFVNAYYDFNREGAIQPYLGAGLGFTQVDVNYSPSNIRIIDGDDTVFAWQLKAGATWKLSDAWEIYGEYAYRQSEDVSLDNQLFPGTLDIENNQSVISGGVRFRFG